MNQLKKENKKQNAKKRVAKMLNKKKTEVKPIKKKVIDETKMITDDARVQLKVKPKPKQV